MQPSLSLLQHFSIQCKSIHQRHDWFNGSLCFSNVRKSQGSLDKVFQKNSGSATSIWPLPVRIIQTFSFHVRYIWYEYAIAMCKIKGSGKVRQIYALNAHSGKAPPVVHGSWTVCGNEWLLWSGMCMYALCL